MLYLRTQHRATSSDNNLLFGHLAKRSWMTTYLANCHAELNLGNINNRNVLFMHGSFNSPFLYLWFTILSIPIWATIFYYKFVIKLYCIHSFQIFNVDRFTLE